MNLDTILLSLVTHNQLKILKFTTEYMKEKEIYPNIAGAFFRSAIEEAAKLNNLDMIKYIVEQYPETKETTSQDWPFLHAMKKGSYSLALFFVKQLNGNLHAKNDLGYKLMEKNHKNNIIPNGKDKDAHDELMDLYHIESKKG